jgi:hypothetical protein
MDAHDKPLIMILVKRAAILMFVICTVSIFYWVVGSWSSFLDETQSMLLDIMRLSSLGIVASSGIGILLAIGFAISRRYRIRLMGVAGYVLSVALGGSALYLAQSVIFLSRGLR